MKLAFCGNCALPARLCPLCGNALSRFLPFRLSVNLFYHLLVTYVANTMLLKVARVRFDVTYVANNDDIGAAAQQTPPQRAQQAQQPQAQHVVLRPKPLCAPWDALHRV